MKNHFNYLKQALLIMSLGLALILSSSLGYAKEAKLSLPAQSKSEEQIKQHVVYLNESNLSQLITLKGIGHTKAKAIMAYRQQFGDFKSIDELASVSGIGDKIIKDNKARLAL